MHGQDISPYNARIDYLFFNHLATVGIGDGGNEIGMGNLASVITTVPSLVKIPCVTTTTKLIASSVSNWGGYGLVAALSRQRGKNLLPSVEAEQDPPQQLSPAGQQSAPQQLCPAAQQFPWQQGPGQQEPLQQLPEQHDPLQHPREQHWPVQKQQSSQPSGGLQPAAACSPWRQVDMPE